MCLKHGMITIHTTFGLFKLAEKFVIRAFGFLEVIEVCRAASLRVIIIGILMIVLLKP